MSNGFKSTLFRREKTPGSVSVLLARFPQKRSEDPTGTDWLIHRAVEWFQDTRIHAVLMWSRDDTPITMSRNACIEAAKEVEADFILMIDSDMFPDKELTEGDPDAKPFWKTSFDFAYDRHVKGEPCIIAAPYTGPPPIENIYVFHWATEESDCVDRINNFSIAQYSREHASMMTGIVEAAALATGLIIIDMQAFKNLEPPYFYYEYPDKREAAKASTEDVTFTRDMSLIGIPQYCNWDSWAGHVKFKVTGKPRPIGSAWVSQKITNALAKPLNINSPNEQFIDFKPPANTPPPTNRLMQKWEKSNCQHTNWKAGACVDCGVGSYELRLKEANGQEAR